MKKPRLIIMTGIAGSGKSYFAEMAAQKLQAIWVSGDSYRNSVFDDPKKIKDEKPEIFYDLVFRSMDYFIEKSLSAGLSIIYEAQNNRDDVRKRLCEIAKRLNAEAIIVYINTDVAVARDRAANRSFGGHHVYIDPKKHHKSPDNFEEITFTDKFITIDGLLDKEDQWQSFVAQFNNIWGKL